MAVVLIVLILVMPLFGGYSPALTNNPELDQFILRIANRYVLEVPRSFYSKPMHAAEVMHFLKKVDSLDAAGVLTRQESFRFKNIRKVVSAERSLFKLKKRKLKTENYINLSLLGDITPYYDEQSELLLKGIINPKITGTTGKISYFSEVGVWTEYRSDSTFRRSSYQPYDGNPYNLTGDRVKTSSIRSSDLFRGGIYYEGNKVDLETAVDYLRQGPAFFYPLTFSGDGSPVTYFRARMDLTAFEYVHTFGLLRTQKNKPKYFYTHRLDFPLFKDKVMVGINEVIINGSTAEKAQADSLKNEYYGEERGWEWIYMIPFVPYTFAEHYMGDRDNAVLSFDLSVSLPQNFFWYIEFFLDDIDTPLSIFGDDFGNKWALSAGAQFYGDLLKRDITISFEYSRIEPWVYTHFYGGSHRYTHYGQSLGSSMGPNSDALIVMAEYAVGPRNTLGMVLRNTRKGTDRGSSVRDVFQYEGYGAVPPDNKTKESLGNDYQRITTFGLLYKLTPFGIFNVSSEVTFDSEKKVQFHAYGGFSF